MSQHGRVQSVLVAHEQLLYRSGLRTVLGADTDLQVIGEASTISDALLKGRIGKPDIVLMSASLLAGSSGPEREQIGKWAKQSVFVVLGEVVAERSPATPGDIEPAVSIPKNTSPGVILESIRRAARGDEADASLGNTTRPDLNAMANAHSAHGCVLTSREQEIVKLLAEGRTVRETAAELALSAKTVDAHKLNAMRKLDIHNREKLIQYAISQRLVPVPDLT